MSVRKATGCVLLLLVCQCPPVLGGGIPTIHGWDNETFDNLWGTALNWTTDVVAGAFDPTVERISLAASSADGPQTIDLGGVVRDILRIEAVGVDTTGGTYTFENGTIEIHQTVGNAIVTSSADSSLTFEADIQFAPASTGPRFNVVEGAGPIIVNGNVAPSPTSTGVTTLELTSRDLTLTPSISVSGVISDGTNPSSTLALRAGFETDSDNHRGIVRVSGANTYSGRTTVNGAVLEFNSIADADGTPSALGAPVGAFDGRIRLGAVDTNVEGNPNDDIDMSGTLWYTGAGHSSNRNFELIGSGGVLLAGSTATGGLTLSGDVTATSASDKVLELTGQSSHTNTLGGAIFDGAGEIELLKTGSTEWRLTGTLAYTGDTRVVGGTLTYDGATLDTTANLDVGDVNGSGSLLETIRILALVKTV